MSDLSAGAGLLGRFEATRIINLPHRADRRRETEKEFRRVGYPIDHRYVQFSAAQRPESAGGFETIGTHGCFLSHLAVLKESLAKGHAALLILEDDIAFTGDLHSLGDALTDTLIKNKWGIFYGGHEQIDPSGFDRVGSARLVPVDMPVRTAHFVAFWRPTIEVLVPYLEAMLEREPGSPEGGPMHVDGAYGWFRRAHPEVITLAAPFTLARQRPSRTDIHALPLTDRLPVVRDVKEWMRRALPVRV